MMVMQRVAPLLSYIVLSFNQRAFIRDALESALNQTYSPLEIVISDDCSTDGTFEDVKEVVARYSGPHAVQLSRNPSNLGTGANVNRAMELCNGEFVIVAAGDDVSLPNRTEVVHKAWEASGRRATSVFSSYQIVSAAGETVGLGGVRTTHDGLDETGTLRGPLFAFLRTRRPAVNGCTHAWSPELFRYFGALQTDLEDLVLSFRSLAIGEIKYIDEPLVRYRRHGDNVSFLAERDDTSSFEHRERRLSSVDAKSVAAYDNMIRDIDVLAADGRLARDDAARLQAEARRVRSYYELEKRMMHGSTSSRVRALASAAARGEYGAAKKCLPRVLPRSVYRCLYQLAARRSGSR